MWKFLQALMQSLRNVLEANFLPWRWPVRMKGLPIDKAPYGHKLTSSGRPDGAGHEPDRIGLSRAGPGNDPGDTCEPKPASSCPP